MDFVSALRSHIIPLAMIICLTLGATTINLGAYPASWLDEGFSMNAAVTLAETGQYGTFNYKGVVLFDPAISSGAPLILPMAWSISVFGQGLVQGRLVVVAFTLLTVILLYRLTAKLYGNLMALWIIVLVLSFPSLADDTSLLLKGRITLGEVPAFMFLIVAILLWSRDWDSKNIGFALASGFFAGLGFLTKLQVVLPYLPTIVIIALLRTQQRKGNLFRLLLPAVIAVGVYVAWTLVAQALVPPALQEENRVVIIDGIRTNFFTNLGGASLSRGMYAILVFLLTALGSWLWRAYRADDTTSTTESNNRWLEGTLAVYVAVSVAWVYIFSIGWPRYIFGGLIVGLLLFGRGVYMICHYALHERITSQRLKFYTYGASLAALLVLGFFTHVLPSISYNQPLYDDMIINYINQNVDRSAVIETWEWDIVGRSQHRNYHMPHQLILQDALRQDSLNQRVKLDYDVMQASPDYLLIGPFGGWMRIYDTPVRRAYFESEILLGKYRLLHRIYPQTITHRAEATIER
jgi:4-amino-4-deoxy-L-arabinose transferase-like glycosyltransferase